jgi:signal transduction histidine kinase
VSAEGLPADLLRRLRHAAAALAYIGISLPLAAACAAVIAAVVLGAALSVLWIGLPLLLAALAAVQRLAEADRRAANRVLDAHLPPVRRHGRGARQSLWRRALDALSDRGLRRVVAHCALKLPLAAAALAAGVLPMALALGLAVLGVRGLAGAGDPRYVGPWTLDAASGIGLLLLALPAAVLAVAVLEALGWGLRAVARRLLAPHRAADGPVREMLAESLGDRTLAIAYWLPDRGVFVDEAGRPVELPAAGSGRAWTAVEHQGRRVAAIIHDAELDAGPELVTAAAAGAALAIDNERLKADLRARVEELRVSRVRIVEAADAARRRLERDLHDGAQQELVALALGLRMLRARLADGDAGPLVDELAGKLDVALAQLRELARGIHPAILTERGLGPAVEALTERAPVPVDVDVDVAERPTPAIEAAAYFVVAEALTNVAKYSQAGRAAVHIRRSGDEVRVLVEDDGVGGADLERGSGLRGLVDRLAALDGTLAIDSPLGGGTRLRARIPCAAGALVADAKGSGPPDAALERLPPPVAGRSVHGDPH